MCVYTVIIRKKYENNVKGCGGQQCFAQKVGWRARWSGRAWSGVMAWSRVMARSGVGRADRVVGTAIVFAHINKNNINKSTKTNKQTNMYMQQP